jgi:ribonucleoside-diphosphate reductase beta chain
MFFARIVGRRQWDAKLIDLTTDADAWPELPDERRARLTELIAGFCAAEDAVSEYLARFGPAAHDAAMAYDESLVAWCFFLQRRDEVRHAEFFDRVATEVLRLPGDTPAERRDAARDRAPAAVIELFDERLPEMAAELAGARRAGRAHRAIRHAPRGIVFDAGQRVLLDDLADGVMPRSAQGPGATPSPGTRERSARMVQRRLSATQSPPGARGSVARSPTGGRWDRGHRARGRWPAPPVSPRPERLRRQRS